ncbi:CobD/CbiB family cobalamin biosynthesis protein [Halobaculum sp. MBLA0143]|uniref:CobD/CbiB family cobalamin biosynthesis protein n=1 Tax=Halobaculum sp. MBLA0143 TaxID=3079933 RepID=UPI0035268A8C
MTAAATAAVAVAYAADAVVGEFPGRVHPVAAFGRAVAPLDREWTRPGVVGAAATVALPLVAAGVCWAVVAGPARLGDATLAQAATAVAAGTVLFSTTSLRMLLAVAGDVIDATETDLAVARERVRALVGRETDGLDAADLRSAAVESAAENLADGLVAPLSAFAVGAQVSLAVGAAAAGWVKAVNTMDSMLGYRSKPVGRASARLDDAVVWLPARATAALLAVAGRAPGSLARARRWADEPASPNSGWPMATLATVLGVRLRKPGAYDLVAGPALPTVTAARRGVRVVAVAGGLVGLLVGVVVWP